MAADIKWIVHKKPKGQFAAFQPRSWPYAVIRETGQYVFQIMSKQEYCSGDTMSLHHPLMLYGAFHHTDPEHIRHYGAFSWKKIAEFYSLHALKRFAKEYYKQNKEALTCPVKH